MKNLFKHFLILFLLFTIEIPKMHARQQTLSSRFLSGKDGLPQGYVSGIVQDKAGFIWIGTRNGLARYDGKKFKVFYHNSNDTTSIAGNIINNIFLDSKNRLWIKYESAGLDVFHPETEKIYHLSNQPGFKVLKDVQMEVGEIYEDVSNGMLFNTLKNGIIQFNIDEQTTLEYPFKKILPANEKIVGFTRNKDRHTFILTNKFLYRLNEKQDLVSKILFVVPPSIITSYQGRYAMFFSSDSILLISGLNSMIKYKLKDNNFTGIAISPVVKTLWGANKYSLVCTNNTQGVFTFAGSSHSSTFNTNAPANITSLVDKTNVLWIGTSGYGIQLVNLGHNSFQYQKYKSPFTAFVIEKYLQVSRGKIPKVLATTDQANIYSLRWAYDKTGKLWMANSDTAGKPGMQVYAYNNKKLTRPDWHYTTGERIKKDIVYGIAADSKNSLWVFTGEYKIHKLNPSSGIVQSFSPLLPHHILHGQESLLIDKKDNFWIATDYGILHYREGWQSYVRYSISGMNGFDVETNRVINITEDLNDENKLWMGSLGNGLICFNKTQKKFTSFTKNGGLPDNTIYSVMTDDNGYLWCSTNQGIFRFNTRTNKARKYIAANGSPDFEFNRFHHLRLPNGRFAFGGFEDYTVFDPLSLLDDTSNLNVAITAWKINNQPAEYREQGSPLQQSINSLGEVHLTHLQNFLTFEVAALQYDQPEIFQYRYMLSGIDNDWVYAGTNNLLNYTALPPGTYKLSINAANASGLWSSKIKELRIIIHPPWWKTWWFYTLALITALYIIYAVYRYRINQVLKLQRVRNRIAKDLHDEIGSTLSTISIYAKVVQQQINTGTNTQPLLTKISDNANQVQDAMNDIVWSINTKNDELENIINRMREHAIQLLEAKDYTVHFSFDDSLNSVKLDMEQRKDFYLIYKEALNNIAKYANGKNVWISLTESKSQIELTIKDDGKGFDTNTQSQSGNGLHNMQSRAQALNGNIKINSEKGQGTIVSLTFQNK